MGFYVCRGHHIFGGTHAHPSSIAEVFTVSLPSVHPHRRDAVVAAVDSVTQGATVSITAMGRGLSAATRIKHRVKRMDRLIGQGSHQVTRESSTLTRNRGNKTILKQHNRRHYSAGH